MSGPTPRHLLGFVTRRLRLRRYLQDPGDGRRQPQIPARLLLWALLVGQILRQCSFHALEALVRSAARRNLALSAAFSEDALGYFTERLDPPPDPRSLALHPSSCQAQQGLRELLPDRPSHRWQWRWMAHPFGLFALPTAAECSQADSRLSTCFCTAQRGGNRFVAARGCGTLRAGR